MAGTKTVACGVRHGATEGTRGVRSHRFMFVHLYSGADIHGQDGAPLCFPFAHSCVPANHIRSLTTQGGGAAVWGKRGMFLSFAGSDVLVAESDGGCENEKALWENDTNQGVMSVSSLSSLPICASIMSRNHFLSLQVSRSTSQMGIARQSLICAAEEVRTCSFVSSGLFASRDTMFTEA